MAADVDWDDFFAQGLPPSDKAGPPAPALPPPAGAPSIYDVPTLTVLLDPIPVEAEDGLRVGLQRTYGGLATALPLAGGGAMRPVGDAPDLCVRLRAAMPWMVDAIELVERQLRVALWAGRPWLKLRPMCLVGPPGSGKSHFAREIGRLAGVPGAAMDLGGTHDAGALTATARGWTNARPCWPLTMVHALRVANPVLSLDELDKAGGSARNGVVKEALLGLLDHGTASVFLDVCLMARVDLSAVIWIATANDARRIPAPLRSRMDLVAAPAPGPEHYDAVVAALLGATAVRWGVDARAIPDLPARADRVLRRAFARHRSIRVLSRHLDDVLAAMLQGAGRDLS